MLLSILSVQVGAALAKILFTLLDPMSASFLRVVFAAVMLWLICRPRLRHYSGREYWLLVLLGATIAFMNLAFYGAIARIPLGIAVALEFVGPLGVAVLGSRRLLDLLWVALAGAGVLLLTPLAGVELDPVGVACAMASALCWGAYILLAAKAGQVFSGGAGLTLSMLVATILLLPVGLTHGGPMLLHPPVLLLGLGVAFVGTVIPYSLEFAALKRMPPKVFGVLMSVEPAIAALVGFLMLGETLNWNTIIAICLVTAAAIGVTVFGGRK